MARVQTEFVRVRDDVISAFKEISTNEGVLESYFGLKLFSDMKEALGITQVNSHYELQVGLRTPLPLSMDRDKRPAKKRKTLM